MEFLLWLFYKTLLIVGILALALFVFGCLVSIASLLYINNGTTVTDEEIFISRITGFWMVHWFYESLKPGNREKEFGVRVPNGERFILRRNPDAVSTGFPIWMIHRTDYKNKMAVEIIYISDAHVVVRECYMGLNWDSTVMTEEKFRETRYFQLVQKAVELQADIEKRFKKILKRSAA